MKIFLAKTELILYNGNVLIIGGKKYGN